MPQTSGSRASARTGTLKSCVSAANNVIGFVTIRMNEESQASGMITWQALSGIVAATFAGCAVVITWLDKRANNMLQTATSDLRGEIDELKTRVTHLENGNREARGHINKALIAAARLGNEDIVQLLEAADVALH